jgi:hypothetical protein
MIRFDCPTCQTLLQVPPTAAGKLARCPTCDSRHRVPSPPPADELLEPEPEPAPEPDDEHTTDRNDPRLSQNSAKDPRQRAVHYVLSAAERAKGFVRPVRSSYLHLSCRRATSMSRPLAESTARDPKLYKRSFCYTCGTYFPIGEFIWIEDDGTVTKERCGS